MKNVYLIPVGDMSRSEYVVFCAELPIVWNGLPSIQLSDNRLVIDGTLEGYELLGTENEVAPIVPVVKIKSVTMRQATQALILAGLDEAVEATLADMAGIEGKLARAEWGKSAMVERNWPLVQQMGQTLELSEEDLDNLFMTASKL